MAPTFSEPGWNLHEPSEICTDSFQADRSPTHRYRTTPLFERVFGLESLAALPRLDDFGGDADELRGRLESLAERRPA